MPFKYDPGISDETDQKIISVLYFGKKRQSELVSLLELNKATVRNHLEYLTNIGKIKKETRKNGTEVYYQLKDGRSKIVPPYPLADNEKIQRLLFTIKEYLSEIDSTSEKITYHRSYSITEYVDLETDNSINEFLETTSNFYSLTTKRYHILSNKDNFDMFFEVLDRILELLPKIACDESYLLHPSSGFDNIIMASSEIYINYENSEENERYAKELSKRTEKMVELVRDLPSHLGSSLFVLAFAVDQREGQKAFKNAIISKNYDIDKIVLWAFEKYVRRNQIDQLWADLNDLEDLNDRQYQEIIEEIRERIKFRYFQLTDS